MELTDLVTDLRVQIPSRPARCTSRPA